MKPGHCVLFFVLGLLLLSLSSCSRAKKYPKTPEQPIPGSLAKEYPKPPEQPISGPGGSEYAHSEVIKNVYGEGDEEYWIFEPSFPTPQAAPLIVFLHGWGAMNPKSYGAWIEHIVRRGNIVIYPRYQATLRTPTRSLTHNAIQAVKDALRRLEEEAHITPELDKFAMVGHSAGGQIAANMAALAKSFGLPEPKAIMCVQPGKSWSKLKRIAIPLEDLSAIPKDTLLLVVVGEDDQIARDIDAKRIFNETPQISTDNKDFIIIVSDNHGKPILKADHFAPSAVDENYDSGEKMQRKSKDGPLRSKLKQRVKSRLSEHPESDNNGFPDIEAELHLVNALDYYGFWKLFDGLCDAAFYGKNREYALGNTSKQRFMGKWSDGTPVKELVVTDNP